QQRGFLLGESFAALEGRHPFAGFLAGDAQKQLALIRLAWDEVRLTGPPGLEGPLADVQPQARLAGLVIGTVAGEAFAGQDGPDVARKVHWRRGGVSACGNSAQAE